MPKSVPYALDTHGALADPAVCTRGVAYTCLECGDGVILRRGARNAPHFAHAAGSACAGESVLHLAAKRRLVEVLGSGRPLTLRRRCGAFRCGETHDAPWAVPAFDEVREEVTFGPYRLDVALLHEGVVVAGVEVYHTHRVDDPKREGLGVPWVEVRAEDVLADPVTLCPVVDEENITGLLAGLEWRMTGAGILDPGGRERAARAALDAAHLKHHARMEGLSPAGPWWCGPCTDALRDAQDTLGRVQAAQADRDRERQAEVDARERRAREHAEATRRWSREALPAQRAEFGAELVVAFPADRVAYYREHARTLRFAVRYLRQFVPSLKAVERNAFIARRCGGCGRPLVCVDVTDGVELPGAFQALLKYFKPPQGHRGYFFNVCPACGKAQKRSELHSGAHVHLRGDVILTWLDAYGQLPRGYRWR